MDASNRDTASVAATPVPQWSRVPPSPIMQGQSEHAPYRQAVKFQLLNMLVGFAAAILAVWARLAVNLPPDVLPFFLVVIAVCVVTVVAGFVGGLTTMIVGGLATWYFLLDPKGSWDIRGASAYALLGYFSVSLVILATSQLYRRSEKKRQRAALELALQEARHQQLFAREMSHRLKNAMTIVQAIASQTFKSDVPELAKFEGRVRALARAHNLLNEHIKQPIAFAGAVVETAIGPFNDGVDCFRVDGEAIALPDQQVVSLSLALHELATNAVKYGALSDPAGWVSIDWTYEDGRFELDWKEHGGPAVVAPSSRGFGSRLLARAAMGGSMKFEPDGLRCTIKFRL
ncbi:MAG TPA: HWE histidine kinase domain-containing protein [Sphingomicrobium sp.]|nr:HWE histidine kinase domain-containing protein [Sphingomicrobium sp.]